MVFPEECIYDSALSGRNKVKLHRHLFAAYEKPCHKLNQWIAVLSPDGIKREFCILSERINDP